MRVSFIKDKKIRKITLPDKIEGNYWIDDTDSNGIKRNLISIEAEHNKWKLISNNEVFILENQAQLPYVYLEDFHFYQIHNDVEKKDFLLYCSPIELQFLLYEITQELSVKLTIGSRIESTFQVSFLSELEMTLSKENDCIYLTDHHSKYGIYVNDVRVIQKKEIKSGDCIFLAGIKMVFLSSNQNGEFKAYLGIGNQYTVNTKLMPTTLPKSLFSEYTESKEEIEFPLYDENEYFHKMPRFLSVIEPLEIKVDAPPTKQEEGSNSILLTIGPMITMSMTSLVTGYTALNNVLSGTTTWENAMPSLIICGAMFASIFIWPLFSKWMEKRNRKHQEKMRQKKYGAYIEEKKNSIIEAKKEQSIILNNNYPNMKVCEEIILKKYTTLWQKRIEDDDYLKISLGYGTCPMQIQIHYPEDHFSMAEDNLKDMVSKLGSEPKLLTDVPIEYSLIDNYVTGFIGEEGTIGAYIRRLILQIVTFHSYDDLKIIFLTDNENEYQWKVFKDLPHIFTDDKHLRFFATNNDEYKEVCYYLDRLFKTRVEALGNNITRDQFDKTYLIITDNFKKIRDFDIIEDILENKKYYGFTLCILDHKITSLPDQCKSFITLTKESGELNNNMSYKDTIKFTIDVNSEIDFDGCIQRLANIPIELSSNEEGQLPNKLGFLEMFDVGKIEQLNSFNRWQKSNPILNLQVPVGSGKNGENISIDLHEKYHGPHGLIAGMTGSGKSEFIITYILSMAINYHPYEVQFILIDYKGGGLAGAFENKSIGLKLPHLVGTITNLDVNEMRRSLASIESELKRRQRLFNQARELSGESTIDIYKYQKMYREGKVEIPVSHLFIICDEFAELKSQRPEFMEQLISTARIGRSLGVHLILATQKPSGVVDPQIWSNTRFRVCMRVQEKSDSNEVIKCPDAAFLKQTGRFYFQVGYNEVFVLGQAAWAGGKYVPAEKVKKTIDTSLNLIDNIGYTIKTIDTKEKQEVIASNGEELINLVKYLDRIANDQKIECKPLWLEKIPAFIKVDDLKEKYQYQKESFVMNPIIGEYDIPENQSQKLLTLPLSEMGNALIYGTSGSGKEMLITTLIYSCMLHHRVEELNLYLIDFGSGSLKVFQNCNLIGDILFSDDLEKIRNLYKMLNDLIEERKNLFADYNGEYANYCKNSGSTVPNIVVIINNYESYQETYPAFDDTLVVLSRECNRYGIYFVVTCNTPNAMRYKIKQNFALTYVLQQNSEDDYTTILGNVHKNYPSKLFGRGIFKIEDSIYEFQTAFPTEKEQVNEYMKVKCEEYNQRVTDKAYSVPVLPKVVEFSNIQNQFGKTEGLIIGIEKENLEVYTFDFYKNFITLITTLDLNNTCTFINPLIQQNIALSRDDVVVIRAEDYEINPIYTKFYHYIDSNYDVAFQSLYQKINEQNQLYKTNNYSKDCLKGKKKTMCIIIGIDSFKNKLNEEHKSLFADLFTLSKDLDTFAFVLVDSIDKIKKIEFDSWYKECVNPNNGIWIGNGINDQFTLKISNRIDAMREEIPYNFCFVIQRGKPTLVKYVEKLDLKMK